MMSRRDFVSTAMAGAVALGLTGIVAETSAQGDRKVNSKKAASGQMKIDVFPHISPPKYTETLVKNMPVNFFLGRNGHPMMPVMHDIDARLQLMDQFEGYCQILNITGPAIEDVAKPKAAVELAKIANDEMAELVVKYPDKFLAAIAALPMNDIDAALKEVDRAITDLNFRGIQITTTIMDKPLDSPEFGPLFEKMDSYNLPILMHPRHIMSGPRAFPHSFVPYNDFEGEKGFWAQLPYNWPFETTIAMGRIGIGGLLDKYPNLKIITHHCGGLTPYQAHRVDNFREFSETRVPNYKTFRKWPKKPVEYYKMFYGDTACYGNTGVLMCGLDFFGVDHVLFGTDMPWDSETGYRFVRETIRSVEEMNISDEEREKIYSLNAKKLFRLPV